MTFIELIRYGDFEVPYTDSVWINEHIDSFKGSSELSQKLSLEEDINVAYNRLKKLGFRKLRTKKVIMGRDL